MPTLPSNATRDAARVAHERKLSIIAEVDLDRCSNVYGVTPCTAGRVESGTAQAGAARTITLRSGASAVDGVFVPMTVRIVSGTGSGQERRLGGYVGATKVATLAADAADFSPTPNATSVYDIINRPVACYNTRINCQDKPNYVKGMHTYKFCLRGAPFPPGEAVRPYIMQADAALTIIDPEAGLARRNSLRLTLTDEPDSDVEQDPYATDRTTPAGSTFWRRLVARNPNTAGRFVRVRRGYVLAPWDWATFLDELYIIDRLDGPYGEGQISLTLKDPIKLTDRTQVPVATDGKLALDLKAYAHQGTVVSAGATTAILPETASGADDAYNGMELYITNALGAGQRRTISDYAGPTRTATVPAWDVVPGSSSDYEISALSIQVGSGKGTQYADPATSGKREFVRIGEEIVEYTAKSTDTMSWASSALRAQFGSERKDHPTASQVQLCRAFIAQPVTTVVRALLEEGGIAATYIDTAALTEIEVHWYGEPFAVTCCVSQPETASALLSDLLPQISAVMWWSVQTQKAVLVPVMPRLTTPIAWTDAAQFIEDSVAVNTLEELRITYAAMYYGIINATSNRNEAKNYGLGEIVIDTDSEGANEYGDRRTAITYSRWFGASNQIAMRAFVGRQIAARRDAPRSIQARLDPKDYTLPAGELVDITTRALVDSAGAPLTTRCLITKIADAGTHIEVELRTTGFTRRYGFIAPDATADYPTNTVYAHIAQNTGLMTNGDAGYLTI